MSEGACILMVFGVIFIEAAAGMLLGHGGVILVFGAALFCLGLYEFLADSG